jgi:hypothetical protein
VLKEIGPLSEENFYNLERPQKYELVYQKSLRIFEYCEEHGIPEEFITMYTVGFLLGSEKFSFSLHVTMFRDAMEVGGSPYVFDISILCSLLIFVFC